MFAFFGYDGAAMPKILNVSFYRFTRLHGLEALRNRMKARAVADGLHGSILLSEEGINGFLAGPPEVLRPFLAWLFVEIPGLTGLQPKESFSSDIPFTRMLVKIKKEIITMGRPDVMPSEKTGKTLSPSHLRDWYESKKDFVIVDTRNDYEIAQGAFKNSVHYGIETFREFPEKLEREAGALKDKTVVMYCTGGIRCEKATALAMDLGIKDVYQLEGGILKYFEEVGGSHFDGECFVFDHRAAVDSGLKALPERKFRAKTSDLKLHVRAGEPGNERVRLAMRAKGLPFEELPLESDAPSPVFRAGETVIVSANAVLDHLDHEFSETRSFTPDSEERAARMRLWLEWVDQTLEPAAHEWIHNRASLSAEASHGLEVRLEKLFYRLKTPLQRNRRFLVTAEPTQADFAAYAAVKRLRDAEFPRDYPERFDLVLNWMNAFEEMIHEAVAPAPKILRRPGEAVWPA